MIADNVGDNVGDCAGMAADLFETYAVTAVAVMLLGTAYANSSLWLYPLALGGISILASIIGTFFARVGKGENAIINALYMSVLVATVLSAIGFIPVTKAFDGAAVLVLAALRLGARRARRSRSCSSRSPSTTPGSRWSPVKKIAEASTTGHATNIIAGLAKGMEATALPVIVIAGGVIAAYEIAGGNIYGIGVAVMAQLSMCGLIVALDAFGPVTDNAGGIAEMADMPESVRGVTDPLDAVGNTTKAVTKGYAIGSAGLAALILFDEYTRGLVDAGHRHACSRSTTRTWSPGLFIGGMMPFLFAALAMTAVGRVGGEVVEEVRRQFREDPGIMEGTSRPDYSQAVGIVTALGDQGHDAPGRDPDRLPDRRRHHQPEDARRAC